MTSTMTPEQKFATQLTILAETFGRQLTEAAMDGYWIALKDLSHERLSQATRRALSECRFMPSPAELRDFAGDGLKALEAACAEAWGIVRRVMDTCDSYESVDFGPLVNAVLHNLGGWKELCEKTIPELVWVRKDFERIYELFAYKPVDQLRGEFHMGTFGHMTPKCIAIGGVAPPKQIATAERNGMAEHIRKLADSKDINHPEEP